MWISAYWYEKLPALYAGAGAACWALFGLNGPGALSGALLLGAAGLTWHWRRSYRAGQLAL
ncbi:hypothetical protein [Paucibacter soli]|uniref:hypothetical protein n=1 Tax=Paucibacter soli TaxID=3133433 RepID=UPI0030B37613